jgi:hypothetical protein
VSMMYVADVKTVAVDERTQCLIAKMVLVALCQLDKLVVYQVARVFLYLFYSGVSVATKGSLFATSKE